MAYLIKNRKKALALAVVFILLGGFFVLGAPQAKAISVFDYFSTGGVYKLIGDLLSIIQRFFAIFLNLAASLLDGVFQIGKFQDIPVVNAGWQVTRGLCNMFFALILLMMAVATILQIETFGIKKILPRLVIAALLINFSLLFASIIIDFSQVFTGYFIDAAKGSSTISKQLMNGLNIAQSLSGVPNPKAAPAESCAATCPSMYHCELSDAGTYSCVVNVDDTDTANAYIKIKEATQPTETGTLNIVIGYFFSVIITIIATFVVLAAAILLIFRIVALWLLLIFAPIAWLSYITGTGGLWQKWWSNFLKWTFFAPIYAFFIYLAVLAVGSGSFGQAFSKVTSDDNLTASFNSLTSSVQLVLQYVVIIIILVGGLYVAQTFGIKGAGAMMSWGKKAGKAAGKWTGRKATGYDVWAPKAMSAAGSVVGILPGFKKIGGIMKGKAIEMKEKQLSRRENQLYAKYLNTASEAELQNNIDKGGINGLMAARIKQARGTLQDLSDAAYQKVLTLFDSFGMEKDVLALEELKPQAVKDASRRKAATERAAISGAFKKWKDTVLTSPRGTEIIKTLQEMVASGRLSQDDFNAAYKGWSDPAKTAAQAHMKSSFNNNFADPDEIKRRRMFTMATGKIKDGFTDTGTGSINTPAAETYIQKMTPYQMGNVYEDADLEYTGEHITAGQLFSIRGELSGYQKKKIKDGVLKGTNAQAITFVNTNQGWMNL